MRLFNIIDTQFERFDETVHTYLQKTLASLGINYTNSQIFGAIFNAVKGVVQNAMFYIEDALTEQNLFTAVRKKSIYNLAKISGYKPWYGQAASGTVLISTRVNNGMTVSDMTSENNDMSTKIYIKNNTQLRNTTTGLLYTMMMPTDDYVIDISKPLIQHEFKVVEGTFYFSQYTSTGIQFETFSVGVNGLYDDQYIEVYVNGEKWNRACSVYDLGSEDKGYIIRPGYESLFEVGFGNDIYGKGLEEGDTVRVKYLQHSGSDGNITSSILNENSFMFDTGVVNAEGVYVNGANYITIKVKNPISGGSDADTIQSVKNSIGGETMSNVYITPENFMLFLRRFSFVGWCNVICEANSLSVTGMCLKNIKNNIKDNTDYYNIIENDILLTNHEKDMIISSLNNSNKLYAGIQFSLQDPIIRKYAMICYVKLTDHSINRIQVQHNIESSVADYFLNIQSTKQFIPKTDIILKVMKDNSDTIESFQFDFISEMAETAKRDGYFTQYKHQLINGTYKYIPTKVTYEKDNTPGLDDFGNIQLDTELETVLLHGGFNYYPDDDTENSIKLNNTIQVYFI